MTTKTVYGQTLPPWLGNGDEHHTLELDMTGVNVKRNLYLLNVPLLICWVFIPPYMVYNTAICEKSALALKGNYYELWVYLYKTLNL